MCIFGGGAPAPPQVAPPPAPVPAPSPPQSVTISSPPSIQSPPEEKNIQRRPKTLASRRRAASGAVSGKRRFTIPLNAGGGGGTNY